MFTRHLYRYDEVRSALLWCIVHKRTTEAIFWTQELLDSGCHTELFQILFEGWIWFVGVTRMEWFRQYWILYEKPDVNEEELISLVNTLLRIPERDSSVLFLLLQGPTEQIERFPPTPKAEKHIAQLGNLVDNPLKQYLIRAFHLGKASAAWTLANQLLLEERDDVFWNLIGKLDLHDVLPSLRESCSTLFPEDSTLKLASQVLAVGFLCLSPKHQTKSCEALSKYETDSNTHKQQAEWKSLEGRRKRRIFAPHPDCLSWITSRGCNPYTKTTIKEVRNLSIDVLREKGCPFWQETLEKYNPWSDDDAFENFWDDLFPDDIPDEWSLEDQKKSHGPGILRPNESPLFWKLVQKWFLRTPSVLVWNAPSQLIKLCSQDRWKELRIWTTGLETPYDTFEGGLTLERPAKAIRFEVLSG
jgi:hypothetical protein